MKVLIGHDGSSHATAAIDDLRWAGLPANVETLVVTVDEIPDVAPLASHEIIERAFVGKKVASIIEHANKQVAEALEDARKIVAKASAHVSSMFPGWQVESEILTGTPATELIRRAREWDAELIVVGSHGRSALGRFILGSVSTEVAAGATCSVRIGRGDHERHELKVLVALDNSAEAQEALRLTLQRSWPAGTELRVVGVGDEVRSARAPEFSVLVDSQMRVKNSTGEKFVLLSNGEPKITAGVVKGSIESVLVKEADEWEADCIVVGQPSDEQVRELAANTKCSLEIIRLPGFASTYERLKNTERN